MEKRTVFCNKEIIEVIMDDLLYAADTDEHDRDENRTTPTLMNTTSIFELVEEDDVSSGKLNGREVYKAVIPNMYQYDHVIQMVACGLSFRQTNNVIDRCKSISNDTKFGCISVQKV